MPTECAGADDRCFQYAGPAFLHALNQENPREFREISPCERARRYS